MAKPRVKYEQTWDCNYNDLPPCVQGIEIKQEGQRVKGGGEHRVRENREGWEPGHTGPLRALYKFGLYPKGRQAVWLLILCHMSLSIIDKSLEG